MLTEPTKTIRQIMAGYKELKSVYPSKERKKPPFN
jgi:hypothetical protein